MVSFPSPGSLRALLAFDERPQQHNRSAMLFVCRCLSVDPSPDVTEALRRDIVMGRVDWIAVVATANALLVTPALEPSLSRRGLLAALPHDLQDYLRLIRATNAARNSALRAQLVDVAGALNDAGIVPMALKGAVALLAGAGEGVDADGRMMADLDVLVRRDEFDRAAAILGRSGYKAIDDMDGWESHARTFARAGALATIDLHRSVGRQRSFLPAGDVWSQALPLPADGADLLAPAPTHRLAHLVFHRQIQNQGHGLGVLPVRDLHDFATACRRHGEGVDWSDLTGRFERFGWSHVLRNWFGLAERLLGLPRPPAVPAPRGDWHYRRCMMQQDHPAFMTVMRYGTALAYPFSATHIDYLYGCGLHPFALNLHRVHRAGALLIRHRWRMVRRVRDLVRSSQP